MKRGGDGALRSGRGGAGTFQASLTRRRMIGAGVALVCVPAIDVSLRGFPSSSAPFRAIYDERFDAGLAYAREAAVLGWVTRAIRGDVTQVWFHELAVRWKHGPAAIAGLTTPDSLFVLERLGWDVGMRVIERNTDTTTQLIRWLIDLPKAREHLL
jgi:hypothetical protein